MATGRLSLIINPISGKGRGRRILESLTNALVADGWRVERHETRQRGDGIDLARQAVAAGVDLVAAAGGDGTLNEVVNGLVGSDIPLAFIPLGLSNVFALELGLPLEPLKAAALISSGSRKLIDLGEVNGRYFAQMVGIGLDGEAVAAANLRFKRVFGIGSYILGGIKAAVGYPRRPVRVVDADQGIDLEASTVVVGNGRFYGGRFTVTPQADLSDGVLDAFVAVHDGFPATIRMVMKVVLNRHLRDPRSRYFKTRSLVVTPLPGKPPVHIQVDGEPAGTIPATITIHPGILSVIAPPGKREEPSR